MIQPLSAALENDHRDRNGLNNTRSNLRPATRSQNMANRAMPEGASAYRGVAPFRGKWRARISVDRRQVFLGDFENIVAAAAAYDAAATSAHGEFAVLNFSPDRDWILPLVRAANATEAWALNKLRGEK
jgi:hypothetical protein